MKENDNDSFIDQNININENIENNKDDNSELNNSSTIEKYTQVNRDATVYKIEDVDLSPDTQNAKKTLGADLLNAIKDYDLQNYEEEHLAKRYRGFFNTMTPEEIMVHQRSLIKKPLTSLPSSLNSMAVQLFKNLVSYMGDRTSSKKKEFKKL